jgi:TldD protein
MRNTCIEPGQDALDDMIAGIDDGYFIDGAEGGQADATGEFMFGASRVRRIERGKIGALVGRLTVSGNAFEVLRSVDAVSTDFRWELGSGHCGKGQPAKVDAGGPYLRCQLLIGGSQN